MAAIKVKKAMEALTRQTLELLNLKALNGSTFMDLESLDMLHQLL